MRTSMLYPAIPIASEPWPRGIRLELYPTMVTPFAEDGTIDYASMAALIRHFSQNGCDGVFAVCQSSEMFYLDEDEKVELARFCIQECRRLGLKCVVSGHTQTDVDEAIAYVRRVEPLRPDAIILVTGILAPQDAPDGVLIGNLGKIIAALQPDTRLGVYECPYPYKRLLTEDVLDFMLSTGRFDFIKDTCCEPELIRHRLDKLRGSTIALYNANAATLLETLAMGAAGYSGIALNYVPELFMRLKEFIADRSTALRIAARIIAYSMYERQNYPANAKFLLKCKGIFACDAARNGSSPLNVARQRDMFAMLDMSREDLHTYARQGDSQPIFAAGAYFASCHASTILPLDGGDVLVAYFAGTAEGRDDVGIWLSRRVGGGWQAPVCIAASNGIAHWNPVLFPSNGDVRIVYKVGVDVPSWESRTRISRDNGATWSEEMPLDGACGPVRSGPIVLSDGRLLAPNSVETRDSWLPRVDVSDDGGASFRILAQVPLNRDRPDDANYISGLGAIQPTLWESAAGCVHMLLRTTCGRVFRSDSIDGGGSWCEAYDAGLPNNNSGIDVQRVGDALYLALNPVPGNWAARTPLVILRSLDNGQTFEEFVVLENQAFDGVAHKAAEFSYPALAARDGRLYVSYTHMRRGISFCEIERTGD